ncbi:uncharacterized protein [Triticum aestivum]|uniref:uncharacterized protein n=1 Tax=Triticum aestivum TaxID=4565 RepID=UPI001D01C9FB|nr:uncharacterized protein LOC123055738 [Triticum aestivum]
MLERANSSSADPGISRSSGVAATTAAEQQPEVPVLSVDGQICAAEGVADAGMEVLLPASKQSVGAMDPKAPGWIKRVRIGVEAPACNIFYNADSDGGARPLVDFWWYLKETFPGDPFHVAVPVRERAARPHVAAALRYFFPFLEWAPAYGLGTSSRTSSPSVWIRRATERPKKLNPHRIFLSTPETVPGGALNGRPAGHEHACAAAAITGGERRTRYARPRPRFARELRPGRDAVRESQRGRAPRAGTATASARGRGRRRARREAAGHERVGEGDGVAGVGEGRGEAAVFTSTAVKPMDACDAPACVPSAAAIEESLVPFPGVRAAITDVTGSTCSLGAARPARSQSSTAGTRGATSGPRSCTGRGTGAYSAVTRFCTGTLAAPFRWR